MTTLIKKGQSQAPVADLQEVSTKGQSVQPFDVKDYIKSCILNDARAKLSAKFDEECVERIVNKLDKDWQSRPEIYDARLVNNIVSSFLKEGDVKTYINHKPVDAQLPFLKGVQWYLRNPAIESIAFRMFERHHFTFYEEDAELLETPLLSAAEMAYVEALDSIMSPCGRDIADGGADGYPQWRHQQLKELGLLKPGLSWRNIYRIEASMEAKRICFREGEWLFFNMRAYSRARWYTLNVFPLLRYSDKHLNDALAKRRACEALSKFRILNNRYWK